MWLPEEGEKAEDPAGGGAGPERMYSQDCSFENSTYHVGDCVYVQLGEANRKPHIVCIERLWEDEAGNQHDTHFETHTHTHCFTVSNVLFCFSMCVGEKWLYGCWFYRPGETFHLATRKFLQQEVFKSDYFNKVLVSKILGKCMVMFVKVRPSYISERF